MKSSTAENMGKFSAEQSCPGFQKEIERVREVYWKTFGAFCCAVTQKVLTLTVFALVLNAIGVRQSLTTLKRQVATIKCSIVLSILYIK